MDGYRTRLTGLTEGEAGPLFLTGLLRLGADAQVPAPAELVAHMGKTIREMALLYP
ncbi:hypothetical protein [Amycolatopsis mediterranei]|uniref:hypothetical protein n=1 Tax=Amycolatopsis mediterranei TaxID=33910 RepID=UPI003F4DE040